MNREKIASVILALLTLISFNASAFGGYSNSADITDLQDGSYILAGAKKGNTFRQIIQVVR